MTDETPPTPGPLTDQQQTRVDYALFDLEQARAEDLTRLSPDGLILLVERLRTRLDDVLAILKETNRRN
jgi:hypothetical protein